jgi:phosphotransferase system HPr (HPr) family protein
MENHTVHQATFIITDPVGLHARPAAILIRTAGQYQASVSIEHAGKHADARSIIQILGLGARQGSPVTIVAEGTDSAEALAAVLSVLAGEQVS